MLLWKNYDRKILYNTYTLEPAQAGQGYNFSWNLTPGMSGCGLWLMWVPAFWRKLNKSNHHFSLNYLSIDTEVSIGQVMTQLWHLCHELWHVRWCWSWMFIVSVNNYPQFVEFTAVMSYVWSPVGHNSIIVISSLKIITPLANSVSGSDWSRAAQEDLIEQMLSVMITNWSELDHLW